MGFEIEKFGVHPADNLLFCELVGVAFLRRVYNLGSLVPKQKLVLLCEHQIAHDQRPLQNLDHARDVQVLVQLHDAPVQVVIDAPLGIFQAVLLSALVAAQIVSQQVTGGVDQAPLVQNQGVDPVQLLLLGLVTDEFAALLLHLLFELDRHIFFIGLQQAGHLHFHRLMKHGLLPFHGNGGTGHLGGGAALLNELLRGELLLNVQYRSLSHEGSLGALPIEQTAARARILHLYLSRG